MTGNFLKNPVMKYLDFKAKGTFKMQTILTKMVFLLEIIQKI